MADNVAITAGSGTTVAADDISSVFYQRVKIALGADGVANDAVAGSGAVGTGVMRMTLASDDPAVVALQLLDNAISGSEMQVDVVTVPAPLSTTGGGTEATALRVTLANDSTGVVSIDDNGGAITVDNGGTFAVQESGGALTALQIMDDWDESDRAKVNLIVGQAGIAAGAGAVGATVPRVTLASDDPAVASLSVMDDWDNAASDGCSVSGDVAHDTADAGEPVKIGAKAITALSGATLVASGDRTNAQSDLEGAIINRENACIGDWVNGTASNTDGTSTQVLAAGAAGIKHYITDVMIANTSSSNIFVELKDGSTTRWVFPVPANSGCTKAFKTPIAGTAATAWNFDPSAAATTVYCSVAGFKSKI